MGVTEMPALPPQPPVTVDVPVLAVVAGQFLERQGVMVPPYRVEVGGMVTPMRMAETTGTRAGGVDSVVVRLHPLVAAGGVDAATASRLVLHEAVHVAQARWLLDGRMQMPWAEGMADAVSVDLTCPFMASVWSRRVAFDAGCGSVVGGYRREAAEFRMVSAGVVGGSWRSPVARAWRLEQLRVVSREAS